MADPSTPSRTQAAKTASEQRDVLVKTQLMKESAASDAKTARLKALRLAKEAEEAAAAPPPAPKKAKARKPRV